jgi:hypothetical protein
LKKLFHIARETASDNDPQLLALKIGEKHLAFSTTDITGEQLHELAYFSVDEPVSDWSTLFEQTPGLNRPFSRVLVSFDYPQSTLLPSAHYRYDEASGVLRQLYGVNGNEIVIAEAAPDWKLHNVYAVPGELHDWISSHFTTGKYWHDYTVTLKQVNPSAPGGQLLVDFRKDDFTVLAVRDHNLLLANAYPYTTPIDVLYYLLKICQEFTLSQQEVLLSISGLVDKESTLYKELYQYFINIEFRKARWNAGDDEYPAHFFTSLNDLAACVS